MRGSYRRDMQRAWDRIHAVPTQRLQTRFGTVEYAERGEGLPILNCHGVLGCHADGVDGWFTNMLGVGFRVISPARFGYSGSTLQATATPADQAEAYALLLDHLGIDRAAILGHSAGSASVLEFTLRHPDRAIVLILANARLGGSTPTAGDLETIRAVSELQFPLEHLTVPTLIVSAVDDHWAPYRDAAMAAERISDAKLVTIDQGGHLFLSHDAQIRTAIAAFIASVTQPEGEGR